MGTWALRLPAEFEWEYAARGTDGRQYPYLGDFDTGKGNTDETGIRQTSAVGIFPDGASPFGVLDMSGNLWEWCQDNWHDNYNDAPTDGSAWLGDNKNHVLRGGSWLNSPWACRSAYRRSIDFLYGSCGFRVVCSNL